MKFFSVFVVLSTACLSQQIPQQVNTILVKTHLADAEAYQKLTDVLRQQGWTRDYDEFRPREWVTQYKPPTTTWSLRLITSVSQGVVSFRGESAVQAWPVSTQHVPLVYQDRAGTVNKVNFEVMNQVATRLKAAIPGSSVAYTSSVE